MNEVNFKVIGKAEIKLLYYAHSTLDITLLITCPERTKSKTFGNPSHYLCLYRAVHMSAAFNCLHLAQHPLVQHSAKVLVTLCLPQDSSKKLPTFLPPSLSSPTLGVKKVAQRGSNNVQLKQLTSDAGEELVECCLHRILS